MTGQMSILIRLLMVIYGSPRGLKIHVKRNGRNTLSSKALLMSSNGKNHTIEGRRERPDDFVSRGLEVRRQYRNSDHYENDVEKHLHWVKSDSLVLLLSCPLCLRSPPGTHMTTHPSDYEGEEVLV